MPDKLPADQTDSPGSGAKVVVADAALHQSPRRSQTIASEHSGLFSVFKANLAQAGLYRPATDQAQASHDDVTLMYVCYPCPFRLLVLQP